MFKNGSSKNTLLSARNLDAGKPAKQTLSVAETIGVVGRVGVYGTVGGRERRTCDREREQYGNHDRGFRARNGTVRGEHRHHNQQKQEPILVESHTHPRCHNKLCVIPAKGANVIFTILFRQNERGTELLRQRELKCARKREL